MSTVFIHSIPNLATIVYLFSFSFLFRAKDPMTESGLNIHKEILLRLEVNDLIRCKSVCKSWNSLTSSRRFIQSHLNYHLKKKVENNEIGDRRIIACGSSHATTMRDRHEVQLVGDRHEVQLVGSSNGLVCISRYSKFLVVNPSTREVKVLRNPPEEYRDCRSALVSGFGYDSSIDDYKVVIGFMTDGHHSNYFFKVLTMKSDVWRSVALESDYDSLKGNGILCNGAIHWITSRNENQVIVSFDLSKEVFTEIPQPKFGRWDLGTIKGCLCIFARPNINCTKNEDIEIWIMRKYTVQESWEQTLPPPGYDAYKPILSCTPHKSFLIDQVHIWLVEDDAPVPVPVLVRSFKRSLYELLYHNRYYAHIRLSTISECNYNYDEHVFVKSLVSPHGMRDGDGGDANINDCYSKCL